MNKLPGKDNIPLSGRPQLNRKINAALIFGLVRDDGPISRAELARRTGIRSTSVSAIVDQLIEQRYLREAGRGESTGGRHPILLEVNPRGMLAAGLEIGEDALNGVIVDLLGQVVASAQLRLPDTSVDTIIKEGGGLLEQLAARAGEARRRLGAVGVAVPGIIAREADTVVLSQPLGWKNVSLGSLLRAAWGGMDIYVLNNAMAGALSEYITLRGRRPRSLLYVLLYLRHVKKALLGSVGCGIVLDGRPYFGEGHMAGEIRVDIAHPLALAHEKTGAAFKNLEQLAAACEQTPERFAPVWEAFAEQLGSVIAHGLDFLDPSLVILGTDAPEIVPHVEEKLVAVARARSVCGRVEELAPDLVTHRLKLEIHTLTPDTIARGAIVPRLQEMALAPLPMNGVFG